MSLFVTISLLPLKELEQPFALQSSQAKLLISFVLKPSSRCSILLV
jgi:hypothetical protein